MIKLTPLQYSLWKNSIYWLVLNHTMRKRNLISIKAKLSIQKTAILPYLTYCNLVGHFCNGSDKKKLERINEVGLPAVLCDSRPSCRPSCSEPLSPWMHDTYDKCLLASYLSVITWRIQFFGCRFNTIRLRKHSLRYFGPLLWPKLWNMSAGSRLFALDFYLQQNR